MSQNEVGRRDLFKAFGASVAAATLADAATPTPAQAQAQAQAHAHGHATPKPVRAGVAVESYVFLRPNEAAFVNAAVDVFIPKDEVGPGGVETGVTVFIDRQLGGAFGQSAKKYAGGPYAPGTPEQGYQLNLTPAEIFRIGIAEVDDYCRRTSQGRSFAQLSPEERDKLLKTMNEGKVELPTVPARTFVATALGLAMEGYFADPIYGGNRDKAAWRMIGFPGAGAVYLTEIDEYRDRKYVAEPMGIADF